MNDQRTTARRWLGYLALAFMLAVLVYTAYRILTGQCAGKACGQPGVDQTGVWKWIILAAVIAFGALAYLLGRGQKPLK